MIRHHIDTNTRSWGFIVIPFVPDRTYIVYYFASEPLVTFTINQEEECILPSLPCMCPCQHWVAWILPLLSLRTIYHYPVGILRDTGMEDHAKVGKQRHSDCKERFLPVRWLLSKLSWLRVKGNRPYRQTAVLLERPMRRLELPTLFLSGSELFEKTARRAKPSSTLSNSFANSETVIR